MKHDETNQAKRLPESERRDDGAWEEVRAELRSLPEPDIRDAGEFWGDLRERLPQQDAARPVLTHPGWFGALGTAAAAALLGIMVWSPWGGAAPAPASVEFVDARLPESVPVVYTDGDSGWTVVWLSNANLEESNEAL